MRGERGDVSPLAGIDEEEVVVEGRVGALHEDAVLRPVDDVRPAAGLGQLAPPAAADSHDRDVEVDAVAARVREGELVPSGENAPGTWIASASSESGSSEPPVASSENNAWRSLPPASRAITQRSSVGEASAAVTRSLAKVTCSCRPSGADAPELQEPGDIGQVAELARRQVPGDRGRADLEVALDHEGISPRATRASDEESSPP